MAPVHRFTVVLRVAFESGESHLNRLLWRAKPALREPKAAPEARPSRLLWRAKPVLWDRKPVPNLGRSGFSYTVVFFSHFLSESWSEARKRSGSGCKSTTTSLSFPRAFWFVSCFEPAMQRRPDPALLYGHRVRRIHHEGCLCFDTDDILENVLDRKTRDRKR